MNERCPTCKRKMKRSSEANRRYWLLLHMAAQKLKPEGVQYSAETFHVYYKLRFLGGDDIKLPNGKVIVMPKSSADLDKTEFHDYVTQVEQDLNERGVYLDEIPA
jgi:hypothetical protein